MLAKDMDQTMIRVSTDIPGGPPGKDLAPPYPSHSLLFFGVVFFLLVMEPKLTTTKLGIFRKGFLCATII